MTQQMKKFGSSRDPKYLAQQIKAQSKLIDKNAADNSFEWTLEQYSALDQLEHKLLSVTNPVLANEARQEQEAHNQNDF